MLTRSRRTLNPDSQQEWSDGDGELHARMMGCNWIDVLILYEFDSSDGNIG